jgi:AbrB family looped-hinge helix DNA binding protein
LTTKGQVTIPKAVRDHLKLETGARLDLTTAPSW